MPIETKESQVNLNSFKRYDPWKAKIKESGDISSVFNTFTSENYELLKEYTDIKKGLIRDEKELRESWIRLKESLREEIKSIQNKGSSIIPSIDYSQLDSLEKEEKDEIIKRGCLIIRNVVPREEVEQWKEDVAEYIKTNPNTKGFPDKKPVVYELYWSKSQVKARSHPKLMKSMSFMNRLWNVSPDAKVCLDQNISYADRLRIRNAGDAFFSLGPHADGGSLERWEDKEYSKCYEKIFEGKWEEFDPYDATHRIEAIADLHNGKGTCSVFRSFQGWLAASEIAPKEGSILFAPLVKQVTAYYMLKPYFDENDNLMLDNSVPGAAPGKGLEFNSLTHPELDLSNIMVSIPKVYPGDMVYWHCDLIHAVDSVHNGLHDSSVFYIPSVPLCDQNLKYAVLQRESFLRSLVGPDFPGFPKDVAETLHKNRADVTTVEEAGGINALREFILEKFKEHESYTKGANDAIRSANEIAFTK